MKRSLRALISLGTILLLFATFTSVAQGQDDAPSLTISGEGITVGEGDDGPTYSVAEAGTYDVTLTGAGFTVEVFVLQCAGAGGSLEALEEGDATSLCDLSNLLPGSPDADGSFEVTFTGVEVDDCGLVFAAGDSAGTEAGAALLAVENPAEDAECEVVEAEGYDEEALAGTGQEADGSEADASEAGDAAEADASEAADGAEADASEAADGSEVEGTSAQTEAELATTGVNSTELAMIAFVLLAAGWLATSQARRLSNRTTI